MNSVEDVEISMDAEIPVLKELWSVNVQSIVGFRKDLHRHKRLEKSIRTISLTKIVLDWN